ncbi:MAG: hypothetical protein AMS25_15490 [Gemmatimonas sp. SM23_52]|nr:MAG: hypothetical protein AMS25_15490 [Gemmatimonas sp. SM23_52]
MKGLKGIAVARWLTLAALLPGLGACGAGRLGVPLAQLEPQPLTTVRPGDVIEIEFWQQLELSGERIVDDDGRIHLPLVRSVQVAGLSAEEIRERLTERYRQYYSDPLIVVNVRLGISITANRTRIELNRGARRYEIDLDDALLATEPEKLRLQSGDWIYVPRRFWTLQRTATYASIAAISLAIASFLTR